MPSVDAPLGAFVGPRWCPRWCHRWCSRWYPRWSAALAICFFRDPLLGNPRLGLLGGGKGKCWHFFCNSKVSGDFSIAILKSPETPEGPRLWGSEPQTSAAQLQQLLVWGSRDLRPRGSEPQTSAAQLEQRMSGALGAPAPGVRNPRHQLLSLSSVCLGFRTSRPRGSEPQTSAAQPEQHMFGVPNQPPPGFGTTDISCSA